VKGKPRGDWSNKPVSIPANLSKYPLACNRDYFFSEIGIVIWENI